MELIPGFDVSHHNGVVDYAKAYASGSRRVVVKATEGTGFIDPRFLENVEAAFDAGFRVGAFHFLRPDKDASAQAQFFLATIASVRSKLLLGIDLDVEPSLEDPNDPSSDRWLKIPRATRVLKVGHFLPVADGAGYGMTEIYNSPAWWASMFGTADFSGHSLWAASYSHEPVLAGTCWESKGWAVWQSSEHGTVPGVGEGNVDIDQWRDAA